MKTGILKKVTEDWGRDSPNYALLESFFEGLDPDDLDTVTLATVQGLCPHLSVTTVRGAMRYFSSERVRLFDFATSYLDETGHEKELPLTELRKLLAGDIIYHPDTGEPFQAEDIFVLYRGTDLLRSLLEEA